MRAASLTHIVQRYFLFPVMISHSNQRVVKYSHLLRSAHKSEAKVKSGLHIDPPHHMQELDESDCKMLLFGQALHASLAKGYGRAHGHRLARLWDHGSWS
jgi:hypothetical protein